MLVESKLLNKLRLPKSKNYNEYCNIILLLASIVFIVVYSSISQENRVHISDILTSDAALYSTIVVIVIASYYNLLIGFTLCVMFIIMIMPFFAKNNMNNGSRSNNKEGFTDEREPRNEAERDSAQVDKDIQHLMNAFKGKGPRTKEIFDNMEKTNRKQKREDAFNNLDGKDKPVEKVEQFAEDELKIEKRKFNPNDEYDNNLKMTMEICDDIKRRITYKYEELPYLKKYISTKIQNIIDLLELDRD